jgi:hypothetical protein
MGIDLSSAATMFSKAMEGNTGALGRYGIKVQEGLKGDELMSALLDQMRLKFGGLAQAMGDTASGSLTKLNNMFGEMREELGRSVLTSMKGFVDWLTTVASKLSNVMKAANDLRDALKNQAEGTATTTDKQKIAAAAYDDAQKKVKQLAEAIITSSFDSSVAMYLLDEAQQKGYETLAEYQKALENSLPLLNARRKELAALGAKEQAQADALAAAAKAASDYADELKLAYDKTGVAQRIALEADIAHWEGHLKVAGASKDKVIAILDELYAKYAKEYPEAIDKTSQALEDMADRWRAVGAAFADAKAAQGLQDMADRWTALGQAAIDAEVPLKELSDIASFDYHGGPIKDFAKDLKEAVKAAEDLRKQYKALATQMATNAFIGFFEAVGSAAGDTDKFAAAMQKLASQLISQIGKELVLAGARVISADPINPVAWGLGLALMAAGGLVIAGGSYLGAQGGDGGGGGGSNLPHMASGGIVNRPTLAVIGEGGPEAVVPLGRGGAGGTTIIVQGSIWAARDLARELAGIQGRW